MTNQIKREYTGTWIPSHIMEDTELGVYEKYIYAEISSFKEFYMSNETLAERINCSVATVTRAIKKLKEKGYIKQIKFDGRLRYLISLKDKPNQNDYPASSNSIGLNNQSDYQDNNIKHKESTVEQIPSPKSPVCDLPLVLQDSKEFVEVWNQFLKQRKPKSNTPYALKLILNKLQPLSIEDCIKTIEYSVMNGYQGIFPLKKDKEKILYWRNLTPVEKNDIQMIMDERECDKSEAIAIFLGEGKYKGWWQSHPEYEGYKIIF